MPIHHQLTFLLLMTTVLLASVFSLIASRNSSGPWFVPLWSRKRDVFSATGWRYRNFSVWCGYMFIAVVAVDQLFG